MIGIKVVDNIAGVSDALERFRRAIELYGLAVDIGELIRQDNVDARLSGEDKDGRPLAPLAPSTLEHRDGLPIPLVPHGVGSRAVADMVVDINRLDEGAVDISGGWPTFAELEFHVDGFVHRSGTQVPARDITGVRPEAMRKIEDAFDAWASHIADAFVA